MTELSKIEKQIINSNIPRRARAWVHAISSRDTDEVLYRLKQSDLANIKFAKSIYQGYQRAEERTGSSLNYYCFILSSKVKNKQPAYFKHWYNIYRHFCIRLNINPTDMIGIEYRILKSIAESGVGIMSARVTKEIITHLQDTPLSHKEKWDYVRNMKNQIKSLNKSYKSDKYTDAP